MRGITTQELFTNAWLGVIAQGRQSKSSEQPTLCAYRGADGTKCAIGFSIPDELYRLGWDSIFSFDEHTEDADNTLDIILDKIGYAGSFEVAEAIQKAHDSSNTPDRFVDDFKEKMGRIAKHFHLEVPK